MSRSLYSYALVIFLRIHTVLGISAILVISMSITTVTVKGKKCKPSPIQTHPTSKIKAWIAVSWSSCVGFQLLSFLYPQMRKTVIKMNLNSVLYAGFIYPKSLTGIHDRNFCSFKVSTSPFLVNK